MRQKGFAPIIILVLTVIMLIVGLGYFLYSKGLINQAHPIAGIICKLKGGSYTYLDFYEKLDGNGWICAPKVPKSICTDAGICSN